MVFGMEPWRGGFSPVSSKHLRIRLGFVPTSFMVLLCWFWDLRAPCYCIEIREKRSDAVAIRSLFFMLLKDWLIDWLKAKITANLISRICSRDRPPDPSSQVKWIFIKCGIWCVIEAKSDNNTTVVKKKGNHKQYGYRQKNAWNYNRSWKRNKNKTWYKVQRDKSQKKH